MKNTCFWSPNIWFFSEKFIDLSNILPENPSSFFFFPTHNFFRSPFFEIWVPEPIKKGETKLIVLTMPQRRAYKMTPLLQMSTSGPAYRLKQEKLTMDHSWLNLSKQCFDGQKHRQLQKRVFDLNLKGPRKNNHNLFKNSKI